MELAMCCPQAKIALYLGIVPAKRFQKDPRARAVPKFFADPQGQAPLPFARQSSGGALADPNAWNLHRSFRSSERALLPQSLRKNQGRARKGASEIREGQGSPANNPNGETPQKYAPAPLRLRPSFELLRVSRRDLLPALSGVPWGQPSNSPFCHRTQRAAGNTHFAFPPTPRNEQPVFL